MSNIFRWDTLPHFHLDSGIHVRKQRYTVAKEHWHIMDRELVNQPRVEILLDSIGSSLIEHLYGLHQPKFLTPFELACWAILTQRNPLAIAHRTKMALVQRWGAGITLRDKTYWAFPEAEQLALASPDELAEIVRNPRKVDYLISVIAFFNRVDEQFLRTGNYDEVAAQFRAIRGFGEWSTHFLLIRGLGRIEHISSIDKELSKAAAHIYNQGQPLSPTEMQQLLNRYGTTQGYWAFYARNAIMNM